MNIVLLEFSILGHSEREAWMREVRVVELT